MLESQENRRKQVLHRCRRAVAVCDATTLDRLDSLMQGLAAGGVLEVFCLSLEVEADPPVGGVAPFQQRRPWRRRSPQPGGDGSKRPERDRAPGRWP